MTSMTFDDGFTVWLLRQRNRNDPVGDLARATYLNAAWPDDDDDLTDADVYLDHARACEACRDAFDMAWREWRRASAPRVHVPPRFDHEGGTP